MNAKNARIQGWVFLLGIISGIAMLGWKFVYGILIWIGLNLAVYLIMRFCGEK